MYTPIQNNTMYTPTQNNSYMPNMPIFMSPNEMKSCNRSLNFEHFEHFKHFEESKNIQALNVIMDVVKPNRDTISIDDIPVPSPKKDFQTLLEEKIKDTEEQPNPKNSSNLQIKPKRPYLKKGHGLIRFRPNSMTMPILRTKEIHQKPVQHRKTITAKEKTVKAPINSTKSLSNCKVAQQQLSLEGVPLPNTKTSNIATNWSTDLNSSDVEVKNKREMEEVRIFELLEEKAENSSFCSTSSAVVAFLKQSTPYKVQMQKPEGIINNTNNLQNLESANHEEQFNCREKIRLEQDSNNKVSYQQSQLLGASSNQNITSHWEPTLAKESNPSTEIEYIPKELFFNTNKVNHQFDSCENIENDSSLHVRFAEYNEYKTIGLTDTSSVSNESLANNNYKDDKAWSDYSCSLESSDEDVISCKTKCSNTIAVNKDRIIQNSVINRNNEMIDESFDETEFSNDDSEYEVANVILNEIDDDYESNCGDKDNLIDIKTGTFTSPDEDSNTQEEFSRSDEDMERSTVFKSELLKSRLQELENEIDIFRKENITLAQQRKKMQEDFNKIYGELREKEKAFEEEKIKTKEKLQEEKKKLIREKIALDNRIRGAQERSQQLKQEKMDVKSLREELDSLRKEFHEKERQWNSAHSRQKSQIRILRTENTKLKQEIEQLQNSKKASTKYSRRSGQTNTKAIHHINKKLEEYNKASKKDSLSEDDEDKLVKPMMETIGKLDSLNVNERLSEDEQSKNDFKTSYDPEKLRLGIESIKKKRNLYKNLIEDATAGLVHPKELFPKTENLNKSGLQEKDQDEMNLENNHLGLISKNLNALKDSQRTNSSTENCDQFVNHAFSVTSNHSCKNNFEMEKEERTKNLSKKKSSKEIIRHVQHPDGRQEFWYANGNVKKMFPEEEITKMIYYNGDVKETDNNGRVKYFYASTSTWHTTLPDGSEILEFPDGQVEKRLQSGIVEISFPDGSVKIIKTNGHEKLFMIDGTITENLPNGEKVLALPNGQREVYTATHKRREYPDGTVKLVYPDGTQETRYSNGRIRLKDKDGKLLMDSHQS
ncbi:centromere protein J [Prorops nasuta]|uniref:centromere protein J n=1 Tax=Prorops nasuta TaxID=863751 RepID=UPI0034CD6636